MDNDKIITVTLCIMPIIVTEDANLMFVAIADGVNPIYVGYEDSAVEPSEFENLSITVTDSGGLKKQGGKISGNLFYNVANRGSLRNTEVVMAIYDSVGKLIYVQTGGTRAVNSSDNSDGFSGINIAVDATKTHAVKLFLRVYIGTMESLGEESAVFTL